MYNNHNNTFKTNIPSLPKETPYPLVVAPDHFFSSIPKNPSLLLVSVNLSLWKIHINEVSQYWYFAAGFFYLR